MTEAEWLGCTDPTPMLDFLLSRATDRKLRLFACACCRLVAHFMMTDAGRSAIDVAELNADGLAQEHEVLLAQTKLLDGEGLAEEEVNGVLNLTLDRRAEAIGDAVRYSTYDPREQSAYGCPYVQAAVDRSLYGTPDSRKEGTFFAWRTIQTARLRDIVGNPFRPVAINPAWLTWNDGTVRGLAEAIYQERELPSGHLDLTRLAVLADALEDAGCDNADILDHCRQPGEHVRGCWVVDLLLGKE